MTLGFIDENVFLEYQTSAIEVVMPSGLSIGYDLLSCPNCESLRVVALIPKFVRPDVLFLIW